MHYGKTITLYHEDGTPVDAREFYQKPTDKLVEGFVDGAGRIIWCRDEKLGIFWYQDTREELYLNRPASTHS